MPTFLTLLWFPDRERAPQLALRRVIQQTTLNPSLFNVYLDELLIGLRSCGYGARIGHMYVGSVAYDVTLVSPTLHGMQKMLDVCPLFAEKRLNFLLLISNSKKSLSTVFVRNSHLAVVNPKLTVSSGFLSFKNTVSHLGVIVDFAQQCKISVEARVGKFFGGINTVLGKLEVCVNHKGVDGDS